MLTEEYGLPEEIRSPVKAAFSTFTAFCVCGLVPLFPYLLGREQGRFFLSAVSTGFVFFLIGAIKSRWSNTSWLRSGLETFLIGTAAAALAYFVGVMLKDLTI